MTDARPFYVYLWTHLATGRAYVGKGSGPRAWRHVYDRRSLLGRAMRKYGVSAFELEMLAEGLSEQTAYFLEAEAVAAHGTVRPAGFNISRGGRGGGAGVRQSPEHREKRRLAAVGREFSAEHRRNASLAQRRRLDLVPGAREELRVRIAKASEAARVANTGRARPAEVVARVAETQRRTAPKGERARTAKLTNAQAEEIRVAAAAGRSWRSLGKEYGVSHTSIGAILRRESYAG